MSHKIAATAIIAGALCGYLAIHLEHTAQDQACVNGWVSDMQADAAAAQQANHELPFQTNSQFEARIPAHITNCIPFDPTQDFVNGSVAALIFGGIVYFGLLVLRKVSRVLS